MGGHHWIAKDFTGSDIETDEVKENLRRSRRKMVLNVVNYVARAIGRKQTKTGNEEDGTENDIERDDKLAANAKQASVITQEITVSSTSCQHDGISSIPRNGPGLPNHDTKFNSPTPTVVERASRPGTARVQKTDTPSYSRDESIVAEDAKSPSTRPQRPKFVRILHLILTHVHSFCRSMLSPPSLSILIAFPIAFIPQLKYLFVLPSPSDGPAASRVHIPLAPDGQAPLAFIIDTANFIGAASIPLGLICLGSALATMKIPTTAATTTPEEGDVNNVDGDLNEEKVQGAYSQEGPATEMETETETHRRRRWWKGSAEPPSGVISTPHTKRRGGAGGWTSQLPVGAILSLAVGKLIVMPIVGLVICQAMTKAGFINEEDKVLRFVCM